MSAKRIVKSPEKILRKDFTEQTESSLLITPGSLPSHLLNEPKTVEGYKEACFESRDVISDVYYWNKSPLHIYDATDKHITTTFRNCYFESVKFNNCTFSGRGFHACTFINTEFNQCGFKSSVDFTGCTFKGASWFDTPAFESTHFYNCDVHQLAFQEFRGNMPNLWDCVIDWSEPQQVGKLIQCYWTAIQKHIFDSYKINDINLPYSIKSVIQAIMASPLILTNKCWDDFRDMTIVIDRAVQNHLPSYWDKKTPKAWNLFLRAISQFARGAYYNEKESFFGGVNEQVSDAFAEVYQRTGFHETVANIVKERYPTKNTEQEQEQEDTNEK